MTVQLPALPAKMTAFDDISGKASSVLDDDFQSEGFQLNTKQASNFGGASSEVSVDLFDKGAIKTPANVAFCFPRPFSFLEGFTVDKLEFKNDGEASAECAVGKALHGVDGLEIGVSSEFPCNDLTAHALTCSATYTGIADTTIKLETALKDKDLNVECVRGFGGATIGLKLNGMSSLCPSFAASYQYEQLFASILAENQFSQYTAHGHYKVTDDIEVAASYSTEKGAWAVGGAFPLGFQDITAKAKLEPNNILTIALKKDLCKGTTLFAGASYGGRLSYGAKVCIE